MVWLAVMKSFRVTIPRFLGRIQFIVRSQHEKGCSFVCASIFHGKKGALISAFRFLSCFSLTFPVLFLQRYIRIFNPVFLMEWKPVDKLWREPPRGRFFFFFSKRLKNASRTKKDLSEFAQCAINGHKGSLLVPLSRFLLYYLI